MRVRLERELTQGCGFGVGTLGEGECADEMSATRLEGEARASARGCDDGKGAPRSCSDSSVGASGGSGCVQKRMGELHGPAPTALTARTRKRHWLPGGRPVALPDTRMGRCRVVLAEREPTSRGGWGEEEERRGEAGERRMGE